MDGRPNEVDEQDAERDHWKQVMKTMLTYEDFVGLELRRRQEHLNRLPAACTDRLPAASFDKIAAIAAASQSNQYFLQEVVAYQCASFFKHFPDEAFPTPFTRQDGISTSQQHRNEAIIHSLFREWSAEGSAERAKSFGMIISELQSVLPVTQGNIWSQRVLVPGSGLGRLPLEISALGYACQGNEFSAFMAIPSNFILNAVDSANCFEIFPWIDRWHPYLPYLP